MPTPYPLRSLLLVALVMGSISCTETTDQAGGIGQRPTDTGMQGGGGDGAGGSGSEDTGEGLDSGGSGGEDTGDPLDDIDPDKVGQVCYPGAAEDDSACLEVVAWDSSWGADYDYPEPLDGSEQYLAPLGFVDLDAADPDLAVAPNFVLSEFMQAWKGRFGVFQPHTVVAAQAIRDATGGPLTINSGYRNVSYNAGVGGATWSRHLYGDSIDMASSVASLDEVASHCQALGAGYIGMYTSHVHCDWRDAPLEPAFYDAARFEATAAPPGPAPALLPGTWTAIEIAPDTPGLLQAPATGFDEGEPRRRWQSLDAQGAVIDQQDGPLYRPPNGASRVVVEVGGFMGPTAEHLLQP